VIWLSEFYGCKVFVVAIIDAVWVGQFKNFIEINVKIENIYSGNLIFGTKKLIQGDNRHAFEDL